MSTLFYKNTPTDVQMIALTKEMKANRTKVESATGKLLKRIDRDLMTENHLHKVTDHEMSLDMAQGIQNMVSAGDNIVFPEDMS